MAGDPLDVLELAREHGILKTRTKRATTPKRPKNEDKESELIIGF